MQLTLAQRENVAELVRMSKEAFDSDVSVGSTEPGGPPEYDDYDWHVKMRDEGHLYQATVDGTLVGGALLYCDPRDKSTVYIGRIFIDPAYYRKGYGMQLMHAIEAMEGASKWVLDTPLWNRRTNAFYQKLGYTLVRKDDEFAYYQKTRG